MTITTEEAERLAVRLSLDAEAPQAARYQPYTDHAMRDAAAALRSLAAERDALQARADQAALGHAREADRADLSEFLHKRDVKALKDALGDLLRCTEKHVFGDECKAQRDKARAVLEGKKDE